MTAALLLVTGWVAIRRKNKNAHALFMGVALLVSFLFLGSYLTYHLAAGSSRYPKEGISRIIYFFILFTHTPLAVAVVPASLLTVAHALRKNFHAHTRIARVLLPVWLYVSVTGVLIYFMLYRW